jgi:hypothetical protein
MKYTIRPVRAYATRAPPGPAWAMDAPEVKNNPVPIVPPKDIIVNCIMQVFRVLVQARILRLCPCLTVASMYLHDEPSRLSSAPVVSVELHSLEK